MSEKKSLIIIATIIITGITLTSFAQVPPPRDEEVQVVAFYPIPFGRYNKLFADLFLDTDEFNNADVTGATARYFNPAGESMFESFVIANNAFTKMIRGANFDNLRSTNVQTDITDAGTPPKHRFIDLENGIALLDRLELEGDLHVQNHIIMNGPNVEGVDSTANNAVAPKHVYDLAEGIMCIDAASGDVVIVDQHNKDSAVCADTAYDTRILGVVSKNPSVAMGVGGGKKPVCLRGKIYCNTTTINGPVKRGDILVSSAKKGYAMRADFDKLKPGMIIGKALENLEKGEQKILVLVNVN
ncbi:MAG: hypothetical protein ABH952_04065 [Candidatus Omnitrophota bacterium]